MKGDKATSSFAGEPQPVEVHHRGIWYSGELLGWRFDDSGRALARVRCVVDGLRHSAWKELADLRLPEPESTRTTAAAPAAAPGRTPPPPVVHWAAIGRHETARPSWTPDRARQHPFEDDDTRPHALLVDRDLPRRPPVPRPAPASRPARDPLGRA
ncbi:hypothetical protein [Geodermatophilus sp. URMC 64]